MTVKTESDSWIDWGDGKIKVVEFDKIDSVADLDTLIKLEFKQSEGVILLQLGASDLIKLLGDQSKLPYCSDISYYDNTYSMIGLYGKVEIYRKHLRFECPV